jgi:hypothetical protein
MLERAMAGDQRAAEVLINLGGLMNRQTAERQTTDI